MIGLAYVMAVFLMAIGICHAGTIYSEDFSSAPTIRNTSNANSNYGGTGDEVSNNHLNQNQWGHRNATVAHDGANGNLDITLSGSDNAYTLIDLSTPDNDPGSITNFTLSFDVSALSGTINVFAFAGGGLDYIGTGTDEGHVFYRAYNSPPLRQGRQGATLTDIFTNGTITANGTFTTNIVLNDVGAAGDYLFLGFNSGTSMTIDDLAITFDVATTDYYWDNDGATVGFGTAGGTWSNATAALWSTNSTGASTPEASYTTTTSDTLHFGTGTAGLGAGTISVSGTVEGNSLDFGSASGAITLSGGTIALGGTAPTITVNNASCTINSVISGSVEVAKAGSSTLTLTGTNTYTGDTTINASAGTLQVGGAGQLDEGDYAGNVSIGSGATFDYSSSAAQTLSGEISGAGVLAKAGSSTLTLSGVNTYTGTTTIAASGGTLRIDSAGQLGNGDYATNIVIGSSATFDYRSSVDQILSGTITGDGTLTKAGGATLTLSGANTYAGNTTIDAGTIKLSGGSAIPDGTGKGDVAVDGTLDLNGTSETINGLSGSGTVDNSAAGAATLTVGGDDDSSSFSGAITNSSGALAFNKLGTGTLTLSGVHGYTGNTAIGDGGGTLRISGAGRLDGGDYAGAISIGIGATLDYSSSADQILGGDISGEGALTMAGSGALTLSGLNLYSGATTVSDGTLLVNGSLASGSTVAVGNGATLGGSGTVNGEVVVQSGGTNAPGTSTDVLTIGGNVTFQSGSTLAIEIDDGQSPTCDKLAVSGTLDISGATLELDDISSGGEDVYVIASYPAGQLTGSFVAVNGMPAGYALMTFYNSGTEIALVKVSSLSSPVWDGDNDGYWNDGVNWVGDALPVEGDNLVFTGGSHLTTTNDFAAGTAFSLEFDGTGFDLTGASIELADNGDNDIAATAGTNTISLNVALTNDSHANVSAGRLEIDGAISGAHSLSKISAGTLVLNGTGNSVSELNAAGGNLVLASNSTTAVSVDMYVGRDEVTGGGDGTLIVTNDASLTVDGKFHMGRQHNHVGTVNQAGGTVTLNNAEVRFGIYNGAHGNYTLSSGILNATDANVVVGWDGYGTFSVNGGTANVKGVGVALRGIDAAEVDTLTLGGGTLNVGSDGIDQSQGQYYNVNLNSGTLGALDDWPSDADMTLGGPIDIDTAGYTVTLSGVLSGAGGFTKKGSGILALSGANSYTGETVVADGELHLDSGAELNTNTIVRISSGAKMDLDANINETVAELWLGGSQQLPGTWGAAAPPAEHAAPAYFQGGGILTVTSGRGKFGTVVLAD